MTWDLGGVLIGETKILTYTMQVDPDAGAGIYTNSITIGEDTATSQVLVGGVLGAVDTVILNSEADPQDLVTTGSELNIAYLTLGLVVSVYICTTAFRKTRYHFN